MFSNVASIKVINTSWPSSLYLLMYFWQQRKIYILTCSFIWLMIVIDLTTINKQKSHEYTIRVFKHNLGETLKIIQILSDIIYLCQLNCSLSNGQYF